MTAANVSHLPEPERKPKKKAASVAAREAEAAGDGFVTVKHRGITLRIPVGGKLPVAAVDAFRVGDNYEGTKQMVGEEQWKLLSDAGMTIGELAELGEKLEAISGN